jgi:hypothetical protein
VKQRLKSRMVGPGGVAQANIINGLQVKQARLAPLSVQLFLG